jgi:predicted alpha/beta-hydrolase family hydrolase
MSNEVHLTLALAATLVWLVGCSAPATPSPSPTPTPSPVPKPAATVPPPVLVEKVSFTTEDGVRLSGTLFGEGELAVILAHQGTQGTDQTSWQPFARLLAEQGFTALTFDFRGRGQSEGTLEVSELIRDVRAAEAFLRERGLSRLVCMGASMGGTSCVKLALESDLEGLVVIASTMSLGRPTDLYPQDYELLALPKLFVCAEDDTTGGLADTVQEMYDLSPEPKQIKFFPGAVHGTELFETPQGDEFTTLLLGFVEGIR